uniref:Uncharacterized protein n=1 Tax=viral metagenome TaxID=1070528 RepID=A0A6H1ZIM4_9ZZZZ
MFISLLRWLGVKVIVWEHTHNVRNATVSIAGILTYIKTHGTMTINQYNSILYELGRIEKSLAYVRKLNKGWKSGSM